MSRDSKTYRILIIEDNPGDLTIVEDFLFEQVVYPDIQRAENFKQASALLSSDDYACDIILLDLTLPDKNGAELISAILQLPLKCPIIILTGFTDIEFSIRSISLGIYDYLLKDDLTAVMLYKSIIYAIERYKSLIKLTRAIIKTQEDDRYQIGSELHDNVCQLIVATQISLGMIEPGLAAGTKIFYDKCKEYLSLTLNEARNLSHQLAPVFFEDMSLEFALQRLLESFQSGAQQYEITVQMSDFIKKLSITHELQLNLYRIVQEQLTNIIKHAKASSIRLEIFGDSHILEMKMTDNGVGFAMANAKAGIGMANMKRRVELFSGKFGIESSPGQGCMINIQIPLGDYHN